MVGDVKAVKVVKASYAKVVRLLAARIKLEAG